MQQPIRCFIIDDEAPAHQLIEKYINRVPYLTLVGQTTNAVDALVQIDQTRPDVLFLDIEMPEMTGFEFLQVLPASQPDYARPAVIMITAYSEFALKGYEHDVLDYLLKPTSFDRFMQAITKLLARRNAAGFAPVSTTLPPVPAAKSADPADPSTAEPVTQKGNFFLVKEDKKLVRVAPADIVFVESQNDYLTIHLANRSILTYMTLSKLEAMLPTDEFLRVNRSYLLRLGAIKEIDGNLITTLDGKRVPIGVTYRERVMEVLKRQMR